MQLITANRNDAGQRLDKLLFKYLNQAPKSFIYKMLRKKNIVLNGKKAAGSEQLVLGDEVKLFLSDETIEKFRQESRQAYPVCDLELIYEDEQIALINKPAGMLSQKADDHTPSLAEYFTGYLMESGALKEEDLIRFKPSVCNRLDRNTSGLVTAGKTLAGLQILSRMFKERTLDKYYLTLVKGRINEGKRIRGFLEKDVKNNKVRIDEARIEDADKTSYIETEYEPVVCTGKATLLKVKLITGKTHQIRSHLASIGHPVAGDRKYGDPVWNQYYEKKYGLKHQLLHAREIHFPETGIDRALSHLAGRSFSAPLPRLFCRVLEGEGIEETAYESEAK